MSETGPSLLIQHSDLIDQRRFKTCTYKGVQWDFSHLAPFAFREEIEPDLWVDVVVFFSAHCFTHGKASDDRLAIPENEKYWDGNVLRVLNAERYELSKRFMPQLVQQLRNRQIRVLGKPHDNYATFELTDENGETSIYAVFFSVRKDTNRKKRLILHIDSAYPIDEMTNYQKKSKKVRLPILLKAIYNGRRIKP